MEIRTLEKADGFLAIDLPGAPLAVGPTRLAPKILRDGAELLARSITYSFAAFGLQVSGASAGINAKPEARDDAITGYMESVAGLVADGRWLTWASTGLRAEDLAALHVAERSDPADPVLTAAGAIAAAEALTGGRLEADDVALVGTGPAVDAARAALGAGEPADLAAPAKVLFVAGKTGLVDHDLAEGVKAEVVVPLTPLLISTKAYAVLRRAGITYVPDFVALAAPLLAAVDRDGGDPVERVRTLASSLAAERAAMWLAACGVAEGFLSTWQDQLPFGRPLA